MRTLQVTGTVTATFTLYVSIVPLPLTTVQVIPGVCDCTVTSYVLPRVSPSENPTPPLESTVSASPPLLRSVTLSPELSPATATRTW